jgi:hypothetical protein
MTTPWRAKGVVHDQQATVAEKAARRAHALREFDTATGEQDHAPSANWQYLANNR